MGPVDPRPLTDRLIGLAAAIVGVALALYFAVHLVESVAGVLVGLSVVAFSLWVAWMVHERRRSNW